MKMLSKTRFSRLVLREHLMMMFSACVGLVARTSVCEREDVAVVRTCELVAFGEDSVSELNHVAAVSKSRVPAQLGDVNAVAPPAISQNHAGCLCRSFQRYGYLRLLAAPAVCGNGSYAVSFPAYDETLPPVFLSTILLSQFRSPRFRITPCANVERGTPCQILGEAYIAGGIELGLLYSIDTVSRVERGADDVCALLGFHSATSHKTIGGEGDAVPCPDVPPVFGGVDVRPDEPPADS